MQDFYQLHSSRLVCFSLHTNGYNGNPAANRRNQIMTGRGHSPSGLGVGVQGFLNPNSPTEQGYKDSGRWAHRTWSNRAVSKLGSKHVRPCRPARVVIVLRSIIYGVCKTIKVRPTMLTHAMWQSSSTRCPRFRWWA